MKQHVLCYGLQCIMSSDVFSFNIQQHRCANNVGWAFTWQTKAILAGCSGSYLIND